jgi:hypothetical protein
MSPFRDVPQIELGSLDVGLDDAAQKAMLGLPRGGRLLTLEAGRRSTHTTGALGSVGVFAFGVLAFVGWTTGWSPGGLVDLGLGFVALLFGGLSLAAVLRASDREGTRLTRPGKVVSRSARRVLQRLTKLAWQASRSPERFGPRRIGALERTLAAAADPELERWIPADVRGRAELLLARAGAAAGGPGWADDEARRRRARELLTSAAGRLLEPAPAEADLAALDRAHRGGRAAPRARFAAAPGLHHLDAPPLEAEPLVESEARAALSQRR